jgi:predicted nucleic acid-binding protein
MLLLDSEAISALAHGPVARRELVRSLVAGMRSLELPVGTVAAVLAELVRGHPADAAVFSAIQRERIEVYPVDTRVGVRAGRLLGDVGAGSELAVDAFVVAVADLVGGALIATVDTADFETLAAFADNIEVSDIGS